MPGVSGEHGSSESHDAKGIQLRKSNCPDVLLKWERVAERIDRLIHDGHYLKSDAPDRKEPEISFTPDVEAYKRLKDEHPRRLVGIRVDDTLLFYGEDAQTAAPLMDTRIFERDIPGMGIVSVTGMPFGRWSVAAKALTENGHGIYFAEPAEQGGYEVVKELDGRRDEPSYQVGDTVYLGNTSFLIEEITDTHVNLRDPTLLYPISRVERRDTFEQMLAEDTRNDELFYKQTDAVPAESENFVLTEEAPSDPATQQPQEEIRLHNRVIDLTGQETERKEAEPYKAQNFRITDDHLGEGGAKTKYAFNIAAIQTLKQIEAEGRQARPDEQEILSRYVGWGGLPQAFDAENASWQKEYQQLKSLLKDEEYAAARGSTLNAHYTSPTVIRAMYDAIEKMGFRTGNVATQRHVRQHGLTPDEGGHLLVVLVIQQTAQRVLCGLSAAIIGNLVHMHRQTGDGFGNHADAGIHSRDLHSRGRHDRLTSGAGAEVERRRGADCITELIPCPE